MLHKPEVPDQQGVRDFLTEGVTTLSPLEMNRVLNNCGYDGQRNISEQHVAVLADLMRRGKWQPKSQIDFADLDGRYILVNGYHRAFAQVRVGRKIAWTIAIHKVADQAALRALYYAFDTNVRPRGAADIVHATGFAEDHGLTQTQARILYSAIGYIAKRFSLARKDKDFLTLKAADRRLALAQEYAKPAQRYFAAIDGLIGPRKKKFQIAAVAAVGFITFRYQSTTAWEFWTGTTANDGLKRGDPRLALFNDMLARPLAKTVDTYLPSIAAWNAFFEGREMRLINKLDRDSIPVISGTPFDGKPAKKAE